MSTSGIELTSFKNGIEFNDPSNEKIYLSTSPLVKPFSPPEKTPALNWSQRAVVQLNGFDTQLDQLLPDNVIQKNIDRLGHLIQRKFSRLEGFNEWLDSNGEGAWHMQLATALAKLPFRAARNIIQLLYTLIKEILFFVDHPLKGLNEIAKMLIALVYALTQPETYTKIGTGVVGASLGQGLITGNPLTIFSLAIGAALAIGGLSAGAIKAAVEAEEGHRSDAALDNFLTQVKGIPEILLTGFLTGLMMGAIQKAAYKNKLEHYRNVTAKEAKNQADQFIKDNNLPNYDRVYVRPDGGIQIIWSKEQAMLLRSQVPSYNWPLTNPDSITITLRPITTGTPSYMWYYATKPVTGSFRIGREIGALGLNGGKFAPPVSASYQAYQALTNAGPAVGTLAAIKTSGNL